MLVCFACSNIKRMKSQFVEFSSDTRREKLLSWNLLLPVQIPDSGFRTSKQASLPCLRYKLFPTSSESLAFRKVAWMAHDQVVSGAVGVFPNFSFGLGSWDEICRYIATTECIRQDFHFKRSVMSKLSLSFYIVTSHPWSCTLLP